MANRSWKKTVLLTAVVGSLAGFAGIWGYYSYANATRFNMAMDQLYVGAEDDTKLGALNVYMGSNQDSQPVAIVFVRRQGQEKPWRIATIAKSDGNKSSPPLAPDCITIVTAWPPDAAVSGVWIGTERQRLDPHLNLFFAWENQKYIRITIPEADETAVVQDFHKLSPSAFFKKWIEPGMPG